MAELPSIPLRVPQVEAPRPGVSPSQVAAPYEQLASTLGAAGQAAEDIAKPLARSAGVQAVTRDENGDLKVERLPIVGPAADEFARAAKWSALAQSQGEARRKDLALAREFQNDPEGYLKAADTFRKDYVTKIGKVAGPEVGIELGRAIDSTTTQQYNSLLAQQQALIKRNFDHDTAALIKDARVDLDNLIEAGGLDTPAGRREADRLIGRVIGTFNERVRNPVLAAPAEETALAIKKFDQDVGAARFASGIKKLLQDGDADKALAALDENFNDQWIPASQRVANRDRAQDVIKDFTQERVKAATQAARLQKQKDDLFEDAVIRSTASGEAVITENDVKKADISPAAKIKMLQYLKRDGMPEPLARVSHETSMDLLRQIRSGDMTGNGAIYDAYDAGKLNRSDFNFLHGEFEKLRTPEGERLNKAKGDFFRAVTPMIDKSNPLMGKLDQDGKLQLYRFEWDLNQRMGEYRQAGKNPYDLLDPSKPDYMGKPEALLQYQKPLSQSINDISRRLTNRPAPPPSDAVPPSAPPPAPSLRRPGESPADYLKRIGAQ